MSNFMRSPQIEALIKLLKKYKINEEVAYKMYQSAYEYFPYMDGMDDTLIDTYYGSKMPMGILPIEFFF